MNELAYQLRGVEFRYAPGAPILHDLDLEITATGITAVVGANGSGKSTLLKVLAAMLKPDRGEIRFFGGDLPNTPTCMPGFRIGLLPQNPYVFGGSVLDNVALGLKFQGLGMRARQAGAMRYLELLGLEAEASLPARSLSGGQVQKMALARLLVLHPRVLLLDEPFTYLDSEAVEELEAIFREAHEQAVQTIIFSSHDRMRARLLSHQVWNLAQGRLFPTSAVNLYRGRMEAKTGVFDTGHLQVHVPSNARHQGRYIAVEPSQVVLSTARFASSMRNVFPGRISGLQKDRDQVLATVDCGESLHAYVTREAMDELQLNLGSTVWVSFKVSAVTVL